jgi:hypothetical protein
VNDAYAANASTSGSSPFSNFIHDFLWSIRMWARAPWFVALALVLQVSFVALLAPGNALVVVGFLVWLFIAGFDGTERIFYLRAFRGDSLGWREVWGLSKRFVGRFVALGCLVVIPEIVFLFVLGIATRLEVANRHPHQHLPLPWWSRVVLLAFVITIDLMLTFVVPALAFSTRSALEALRLGLAMLKTTWPECAWYALAPGFTLGVLALALPRSVVGNGGGIGVALVGGTIALACKGAAVPFYLLRTSGVSLNGAT